MLTFLRRRPHSFLFHTGGLCGSTPIRHNYGCLLPKPTPTKLWNAGYLLFTQQVHASHGLSADDMARQSCLNKCSVLKVTLYTSYPMPRLEGNTSTATILACLGMYVSSLTTCRGWAPMKSLGRDMTARMLHHHTTAMRLTASFGPRQASPNSFQFFPVLTGLVSTPLGLIIFLAWFRTLFGFLQALLGAPPGLWGPQRVIWFFLKPFWHHMLLPVSRKGLGSALPVPYQCLTSALLSALPSALPRVLW